MIRLATLIYMNIPTLARGFVSIPTARVPSVYRNNGRGALNENVEDVDPSVVAAASVSSLCSISGDDPVLKSWCEDALQSEIPQLFEGESELETLEHNEICEEDDFVWKDVQYTEEMISGLESNTGDKDEEEESCVIQEAHKPGNAVDPPKIRVLHPKRRRHLFRYSPDISVSCWLSTVEPKELLLSAGYSEDDIHRMSEEYNKLLTCSPKDIIAPRLRFLVNVLGGGTGDIGNGVTLDNQDEENFIPHNLQVSEFARHNIPTAAFFKPRLETTLAPRHGYLACHGDSLPFGEELLELGLLNEFLDACTKSPAEFAGMCQQWETRNVANRDKDGPNKVHSVESVIAMDNIFTDGIAPFARNQQTPDIQKLGKSCTPAEIFALLINHGSNYAEHDDGGSTILHWTAGTNKLEAMKVLIRQLEKDEEAFGGDTRDVLWSTCASCSITRDGATPLHWAACGVSNTKFGCGGKLLCNAFIPP